MCTTFEMEEEIQVMHEFKKRINKRVKVMTFSSYIFIYTYQLYGYMRTE